MNPGRSKAITALARGALAWRMVAGGVVNNVAGAGQRSVIANDPRILAASVARSGLCCGGIAFGAERRIRMQQPVSRR